MKPTRNTVAAAASCRQWRNRAGAHAFVAWPLVYGAMPHSCVVIALAAACLLVSGGEVPAQPVTPLVNLVENDLTTGHTRISFGYDNQGDPGYVQFYGARNAFRASDGVIIVDAGQPQTFDQGEHHFAFDLVVPTYNPTTSVLRSWRWFLDGFDSIVADPAAGLTYVRNTSTNQDPNQGPFSDTYTHTSASLASPSPHVVVEDDGIFVMDSGTFSVETLVNRGTGSVRLTGGTVEATTQLTNEALLQFEGGGVDTPTLANQNGGRVEVLSGNTSLTAFANAAALSVEGGNLDVGNLTNTGLVEVSSGMLEVTELTNNGVVDVSSGMVELSTGLTQGATGFLRLNGGVVETPTITNQGGSFDFRGGTLRILSDDLATGAGGMLGANPVIGGGTVELVSGQADIASGTSFLVHNGASFIAQGGTNDGSVDVINATLNFPGDGDPQGDNADGLTNNASLNLINAEINGDVHSPSGATINVAAGVVFNGLVSGGGSFPGAGLVTFNGGYSPGDSPAVVEMNGGISFGSSNTLYVELGGLLLGEFDRLEILSNAQLDGELVVSLLDGFTPSFGDTFEFLSANGSLSGQFVGLNQGSMLASDSGHMFRIDYHASGVMLTAVPEPGGLVLLALGMFGLTASNCRKWRNECHC